MVHPGDAIGISAPLLLGIYELGSGVHSKRGRHFTGAAAHSGRGSTLLGRCPGQYASPPWQTTPQAIHSRPAPDLIAAGLVLRLAGSGIQGAASRYGRLFLLPRAPGRVIDFRASRPAEKSAPDTPQALSLPH